MQVGLLICDEVDPTLRGQHGDYPDMFSKLLPDVQFEVYNVYKGQFPASVNEQEAYLCNGSRRSVYENEPWINELKGFVREIHASEKRYIGVCFGHQMLAEAQADVDAGRVSTTDQVRERMRRRLEARRARNE